MQILIATLEGEYAHFRIPETTRENLSYPFPPRTALIGMIAAMMGEPRNSYWKDGHPLRDLKVAIEIVNPLKRTFLKVNYIRVKETVSLAKGTKIYIPEDPFATELIGLSGKEYESKKKFPKYSRGMNAPFKMNLMKEVKYRIYISSDNETTLEEIRERLQQRKFVFPPYLGHANLLAHWEFEGIMEGTPIHENNPIECHTVVPFSAIEMQKVSYDLAGTPVIYNMPMAMKAADPKKEPSIWNIIVDRLDSVFLVRPKESFKAIFKNGRGIRVGNKTISFL
ncbi:MAG: type I-B CRISPR-associated protein Cas5 [Methanobacteriota archaeon]|nr:MAG: type I-B CRISPR-associated protein Cas5 [Euryarchaeota archaeon]